ncbi:hypothetical protein SAMN04488517_11375 [Jannaschia rubra]|nr:hypothetical protein SAMN04488517_11375 [Jannaschia rubra]
MFEYIETFDNPKRKHTNGMLSPVEFKTRQQNTEQGRRPRNQEHLKGPHGVGCRNWTPKLVRIR